MNKTIKAPEPFWTKIRLAVMSLPVLGVGPAGAGSLAQVVNTAIAGKHRFDEMEAFFKGVGTGDTAGIWEERPTERPEFRESYQRQVAKLAAKRKAEEMG